MTALNLTKLEARVDELINAISNLSNENRALLNQQSNLVAERAALIEKSELARSRVESMIARLKAMEVSS
jgi:cell division protein ZapB